MSIGTHLRLDLLEEQSLRNKSENVKPNIKEGGKKITDFALSSTSASEAE